MRKFWKRNKTWILITLISYITNILVFELVSETDGVKISANTSVFLLLLTLVPNRIAHIIKNVNLKKFFNKLAAKRKDIGIASGLIMLQHVGFAMYYYADFDVSFYIRPQIISGFIAEIILVLMLLTSLTFVQKKLKKTWKPIHRLIWVVLPLIGLHAVEANERFNSVDLTYGISLTFIAIIVFFVIVDLIIGIIKKDNVRYKLSTLGMLIVGTLLVFLIKNYY